jgi:hypothetical protein
MLRRTPLTELPATVAKLGYEYIELSPREDFLPFFTHPRADRHSVASFKAASVSSLGLLHDVGLLMTFCCAVGARHRSGSVSTAGVRHPEEMADPERFLRFERQHRDGLYCYVIRAGDADLPGPAWPGLWEQDYPQDLDLNPWRRHAVNNSDGEALAVWRALAWAVTAGRSRFVIPTYYRDEAAELLNVDRAAVQLVRWEYEVDVERSEWLTADTGFVPARACVPLRPAPTPWQRDHAGFAGLFEVASFRQLTDLDLAVGSDASSELTLFALSRSDRAGVLAAALDQTDRPYLADILQPGGVFVDLAVVRDRGFGATCYLTVKAPEAIEDADRLADHFSRAFRRYLDRVNQIQTLDEFHTAIEDLLTPPRTTGTP